MHELSSRNNNRLSLAMLPNKHLDFESPLVKTLADFIEQLATQFYDEPNTPIAIKVLECLMFIKLNEAWITYAINHKHNDRIYKYKDDKQKQVLRAHNDLAFHALGYEKAQDAINDFNRLIRDIETGIESIKEDTFCIRMFIRKMEDSEVGCMEARLASAMSFLADPKARLDDFFQDWQHELIKLGIDEEDTANVIQHVIAYFTNIVNHPIEYNSTTIMLDWRVITNYLMDILAFDEQLKPHGFTEKALIKQDDNCYEICFSSQSDATFYANLLTMLVPNPKGDTWSYEESQHHYSDYYYIAIQQEHLATFLAPIGQRVDTLPTTKDISTLLQRFQHAVAHQDIPGIHSLSKQYPAIYHFVNQQELLTLANKHQDKILLQMSEQYLFKQYCKNLRILPSEKAFKSFKSSPKSISQIPEILLTQEERQAILTRKQWTDIVSETYNYNQQILEKDDIKAKILRRIRRHTLDTCNPATIYDICIQYLQQHTCVAVCFDAEILKKLSQYELLNNFQSRKKSPEYFFSRQEAEASLFNFLSPELKKAFQKTPYLHPRYGALILLDRYNLPDIFTNSAFGESVILFKDLIKYNALFYSGNPISDFNNQTIQNKHICTFHHLDFILLECDSKTLMAMINFAQHGKLFTLAPNLIREAAIEVFLPPISLLDASLVEDIRISAADFQPRSIQKNALDKLKHTTVNITSAFQNNYERLLTRFIHAINQDDYEAVSLFLKENPSLLKSQCSLGMPSYVYMISKDKINAFKAFLEVSLYFNFEPLFFPPLHAAAQLNKEHFVDLLINSGINMHALDGERKKAHHTHPPYLATNPIRKKSDRFARAIAKNQIDIITNFLEQNVDWIAIKSSNNRYPVEYANNHVLLNLLADALINHLQKLPRSQHDSSQFNALKLTLRKCYKLKSAELAYNLLTKYIPPDRMFYIEILHESLIALKKINRHDFAHKVAQYYLPIYLEQIGEDCKKQTSHYFFSCPPKTKADAAQAISDALTQNTFPNHSLIAQHSKALKGGRLKAIFEALIHPHSMPENTLTIETNPTFIQGDAPVTPV